MKNYEHNPRLLLHAMSRHLHNKFYRPTKLNWTIKYENDTICHVSLSDSHMDRLLAGDIRMQLSTDIVMITRCLHVSSMAVPCPF